MKELILKYGRYNKWANDRLVSLMKKETPDLFFKPITSSFDSIGKTILHMADAEYIWLCRLTGEMPDKIPGKSGATVEILGETNQQMIEFIEGKPESFFNESTSYSTLKGEKFTSNNFSILWHVFNHGSFHRGQIVTMLRNGGYTGPIDQTDLIAYERK